MAHELPPLPYDFAALEPHIDAQTMQIHHGKHHQAYVNNLNTALEKHPDLQKMSAEELLRNLGERPGGHPPGRAQQRRRSRQPHDVLEDDGAECRRRRRPVRLPKRSTASFGSFDGFKEQFAKAA